MNELLEYIKTTTMLFSLGAFGCISYMIGFIGLDYISEGFYKKIKDPDELKRIVDEEAKRLHLDKPIKLKLHNHPEAMATILNDRTYQLDLENNATRKDIRHELYHLYKGCRKLENDNLNDLLYFFVQEPQAIIYSIFKIKL